MFLQLKHLSQFFLNDPPSFLDAHDWIVVEIDPFESINGGQVLNLFRLLDTIALKVDELDTRVEHEVCKRGYHVEPHKQKLQRTEAAHTGKVAKPTVNY